MGVGVGVALSVRVSVCYAGCLSVFLIGASIATSAALSLCVSCWCCSAVCCCSGVVVFAALLQLCLCLFLSPCPSVSSLFVLVDSNYPIIVDIQPANVCEEMQWVGAARRHGSCNSQNQLCERQRGGGAHGLLDQGPLQPSVSSMLPVCLSVCCCVLSVCLIFTRCSPPQTCADLASFRTAHSRHGNPQNFRLNHRSNRSQVDTHTHTRARAIPLSTLSYS